MTDFENMLKELKKASEKIDMSVYKEMKAQQASGCSEDKEKTGFTLTLPWHGKPAHFSD